MESIRIARKKGQQALNHEWPLLHILPQEIDAIERGIDDLDKAKAYLEKS